MNQEQKRRVRRTGLWNDDDYVHPELARDSVSPAERFANQDARILIVGVGDPERCDDGVGLVVARALRTKKFANTTIVESSGDGALLSQLWQEAARVFLIDAVSSGAPPGTVQRIDAHSRTLPTDLFRSSSHTFGLAEAVELARALNQLPPRLIVYGIEGKNFDLGLGLSPEIIAAARRVVGSVTHELRAYRRRNARAPRAVSALPSE